MPRREPQTLRELLAWAYANLAMAHAALSANATKYGPLHFMIRARLFKGLCTGTMNLGTLLDDERVKFEYPPGCAYCGKLGRLTIDHLIPIARGGPDTADNAVWSCSRCNSSKQASDMLHWWAVKHPGVFPPLLLIRRYLKLAFLLAGELGALDLPLSAESCFPFELTSIPSKYPAPTELRLWQTDGSVVGGRS